MNIAPVTIGGTTVHRIVDIDPFILPLNVLFPDAAMDQLASLNAQLNGRHIDVEGGAVLLAIQSHLVRFGGRTILIDACVGEHKSRPARPVCHARKATRYLSNLAAAGCSPDDIDIMMCTHLHADHVGWNTWNTVLESDRWVSTFPKARYVMSQAEIDYRAQQAAASPQANHGSFQDSVLPILDANRATIVAPGDEIAEHARIVGLPDHAPGQIGLEVGASARFLFCGDAIHSPVQVSHPEWSSAFCHDRVQAVETRRRLLERGAGEDLALVPAHLRAGATRIEEKARSFLPAFID